MEEKPDVIKCSYDVLGRQQAQKKEGWFSKLIQNEKEKLESMGIVRVIESNQYKKLKRNSIDVEMRPGQTIKFEFLIQNQTNQHWFPKSSLLCLKPVT